MSLGQLGSKWNLLPSFRFLNCQEDVPHASSGYSIRGDRCFDHARHSHRGAFRAEPRRGRVLHPNARRCNFTEHGILPSWVCWCLRASGPTWGISAGLQGGPVWSHRLPPVSLLAVLSLPALFCGFISRSWLKAWVIPTLLQMPLSASFLT